MLRLLRHPLSERSQGLDRAHVIVPRTAGPEGKRKATAHTQRLALQSCRGWRRQWRRAADRRSSSRSGQTLPPLCDGGHTTDHASPPGAGWHASHTSIKLACGQVAASGKEIKVASQTITSVTSSPLQAPAGGTRQSTGSEVRQSTWPAAGSWAPWPAPPAPAPCPAGASQTRAYSA